MDLCRAIGSQRLSDRAERARYASGAAGRDAPAMRRNESEPAADRRSGGGETEIEAAAQRELMNTLGRISGAGPFPER
jgi:hypothetical protein